MARAGILYSHVTKAADQLVAAGKNPTVDNVREALGSTGSKSTIAPMLKQWKVEHQSAVAATDAGLPVELLEAVKGVYERLQVEAERRVEQARVLHQAAIEEAQDQLQQCHAHEGMLSQSVDSLSVELAQTRESLFRLQAEHQAAKITVAGLQADNTGLQQRLSDRAAEVKAVGDQLTQARGQFEHYQESMAMQRTEDRQAYELRIGRLEQDLTGAQQRLSAQQVTVAQQDMQLAQLRLETARSDDEARAAREGFVEVQADRVQLARQLTEVKASEQAVADMLAIARQEATETRMALAAQERQTELLTHQLYDVGVERDRLAGDKLELAQDNATLRAESLKLRGEKPGRKLGG